MSLFDNNFDNISGSASQAEEKALAELRTQAGFFSEGVEPGCNDG